MCDSDCPGWGIYNEFEERGPAIQRCDECAIFVDDDDAAGELDAIIALAAARARRSHVHMDDGDGAAACCYDCAPGKVSKLAIAVTCPICTRRSPRGDG